MNNQQSSNFQTSAGNPIEWTNAVVKHVFNSTVATLFMGAGLSGILLKWLPGSTNFIMHVHGESSSGKTMALKAAASAFGKPHMLVETWRSIAQSMDKKMREKNNASLFLDESGMVNETDQAEILYALGNGISGTNQQPRSRLVTLSTGEKKLHGKSTRIIQFQANTFGTMWPTIKDAEAADAFLDILGSNYGYISEFMENATREMMQQDVNSIQNIVDKYTTLFHQTPLSIECARQVEHMSVCLAALDIFMENVLGLPKSFISLKMLPIQEQISEKLFSDPLTITTQRV